MAKDVKMPKAPWHLFAGRAMIILASGKVLEGTILSAFEDAWQVKLSSGNEGLVRLDSVDAVIELAEDAQATAGIENESR